MLLKYLLDSNVILHLANESEGHRRIYTRLLPLKNNQRAISAIAAYELRRMLRERKVTKDKLDALGRYLAAFDALSFTNRAAHTAANVYHDLLRRGVNIGHFDAMQAGHALLAERS